MFPGMAKRAKVDPKAKPRSGATKDTAEGFFRPFSTLARPAPATKGSDASKGSSASKGSGASKGPEPAAKGSEPAAKGTAPTALPRPADRAPAPPAAPSSDRLTFALYMAGVRTLDDRADRVPATAARIERAPRDPKPTTDPDAEARARMRSLVLEGIRFETTDDGTHIEGRRRDVDPRELRRLRRADVPIDAALDLTAVPREATRAAVESFIQERRARGDRVVAILRGDPAPVLRGELAAWLAEGRAARDVAAFATARAPTLRIGSVPADVEAQAGAVLVLLTP
jgi:DNA-nicking Smr family endonuclease